MSSIRTAALVLAIEDEPDLRRLLGIIFGHAGYEVAEASDGEEGLRVFAQRQPDVVVLDIGLPVLDGWQVLARIRAGSDVPVLLLTARAMEAEKERALEAGANDYVTKPFRRRDLVARIESLVGPADATKISGESSTT
ncbi:MAG TPA: response regulator [Streptosporangiaceae bacterium]